MKFGVMMYLCLCVKVCSAEVLWGGGVFVGGFFFSLRVSLEICCLVLFVPLPFLLSLLLEPLMVLACPTLWVWLFDVDTKMYKTAAVLVEAAAHGVGIRSWCQA